MKNRLLKFLCILAVAETIIFRSDLERSPIAFVQNILRQENVWGFLNSRETRLHYYFGECAPSGYGYIQEILKLFPDSSQRPVLRYPDYNHKSELLFSPARFDVNTDFMIGVGLGDEFLKESFIAEAQQIMPGVWSFSTNDDYDVLSRVFTGLEPAEQPEIKVYKSLAHFKRKIDMGDIPISDFSHNRGSTPFIVQINSSRPVHKLSVFGIRVLIENYRIIHKKGSCFTAVRQDRLDQLITIPKWDNFIKAISNAYF